MLNEVEQMEFEAKILEGIRAFENGDYEVADKVFRIRERTKFALENGLDPTIDEE